MNINGFLLSWNFQSSLVGGGRGIKQTYLASVIEHLFPVLLKVSLKINLFCPLTLYLNPNYHAFLMQSNLESSKHVQN